MSWIERYFQVRERGSSISTEIFAGVSTFLALSYIFVVNPAILAEGGMDQSMVYVATIVGSVIATLVMGLWARLPFAVAPGLEMNAFVAFTVIGSMGFFPHQAMGMVFWSGMLTVALSLTPIRVSVISAIPERLKTALAAAVGIFLMLIALKVSGVAAYEGIKIQGIGLLASDEAYLFYCGFLIAAVLQRLRVKGSILLSILATAALAHQLGIRNNDLIQLSRVSLDGFFLFDLGIITNPKSWSVILVLFILDFYGSIAKFIGLTRGTSIVDRNGNVPRTKEALIVDGGGTVLGASLGTSNLIVFVESAVGIGEGGRTGLTAVVVAILMSSFFFLSPLVSLVPVLATTGALFWVGIMLLPKNSELCDYSLGERFTLVVTLIATVLTFGLDKAMCAAFVAHIVLTLVQRQRPNYYLVISAGLLALSIALS